MQAEHSSKGDEYAREAEGQAPPGARARSIAHRTSHAHTRARARRTHARTVRIREVYRHGTHGRAVLWAMAYYVPSAADPARPGAAQRRPRGAHVAHHGAVGRDVGSRCDIRPSQRWHTCQPLLPHNNATSLPAPIRTRAQRTAAFAFGVSRGPVVYLSLSYTQHGCGRQGMEGTDNEMQSQIEQATYAPRQVRERVWLCWRTDSRSLPAGLLGYWVGGRRQTYGYWLCCGRSKTGSRSSGSSWMTSAARSRCRSGATLLHRREYSPL